jgi:hypothetical protein
MDYPEVSARSIIISGLPTNRPVTSKSPRRGAILGKDAALQRGVFTSVSADRR